MVSIKIQDEYKAQIIENKGNSANILQIASGIQERFKELLEEKDILLKESADIENYRNAKNYTYYGVELDF